MSHSASATAFPPPAAARDRSCAARAPTRRARPPDRFVRAVRRPAGGGSVLLPAPPCRGARRSDLRELLFGLFAARPGGRADSVVLGASAPSACHQGDVSALVATGEADLPSG